MCIALCTIIIAQKIPDNFPSTLQTITTAPIRRSVCNTGAYISKERRYPLPVYWYHSKGNWLRYNFAADLSSFIVETCMIMKDDKFRYFVPILRKLRAAWNLGWWLVANPVSSSCKVLLNFFSYLLGLRRYKATCVKTHCLQEVVGQLEPRYQGKWSSPCQHIDTTRKAIDCATTLPLTVFT